MTLLELYQANKIRIEKLSRHYARMFNVEAEELFQEGMLAVAETYSHYGYNHSDGELLSLSHRIINRKMYKFALKVRKRGKNETQGIE
jgi:DNA-directed RNA polymerase specialized sigma24 family protein